MGTNDYFAAIAGTMIENRKEFMENIQPVVVPDVYFNEMHNSNQDNQDVFIFKELTYDQELNAYYSGLESLKRKYSTFLTRRSKPAKKRERLYFNEFDFRFETINDYTDFNRILEGQGNWEKIKIPHYHGPTGKWVSYYRTVFDYKKDNLNDYIVFKGSDYLTEVYLNGRQVLSHEGFFYPFEGDITKYLREKSNILLVKVENDITTLGENKRFGKKIYAATGIGWDDPEEGWHHCPPGGGIFDKVYIEKREDMFVADACVFPDIDRESAEIKIILNCTNPDKKNVKINIHIEPFNFDDDFRFNEYFDKEIYDGENHYYFDIKINNPKLWDNDKPNLYTLVITINDGDEYEQHFGMRKFHMDTSNKPYGTLFLNNEKTLLRGANEMGHLQLCVINDDYNQLIEDILIAKYCNMNYYRITQRPVQSEIYDYCDMLGMMVQVDFPLFGQLVKSQIYEATRQIGEMEKHIRRHPSVIMVSYINEPTNQFKTNTHHINLTRAEMENWFEICDRFIKHENPYRVIKRVEGDYDPPTFEGLSDFHCYNMWYTNHAIPIGDLYRGYLPAIRKDWKTGCGEYGTEGLDNLDLMKKRYPTEWLPKNDEDFWIPDKIVKAQTNSMHGDWFYEQDNIKDWIYFSQQHQAKSVSMMTLALRRRSDYVVQTALHLLIDAYPSGWMKTVVGVDRKPKPAYFAFKKSLIPFKINLRCDRWTCYKTDIIDIECWILNDEPKDYSDISIIATLSDDVGNIFKTYSIKAFSKGGTSLPIGKIRIDTSSIEVKQRKKLFLSVQMQYQGRTMDTDVFCFNLFEKDYNNIMVYPLGLIAEEVVNTNPQFIKTDLETSSIVIISDKKYISKVLEIKKTKNKSIMFILNKNLDDFEFNGHKYVISDKRMWKATYCPINQSILTEYEWDDLSFIYDSNSDKINYAAECFIQCENQEEVYVFSYKKPSFSESIKGSKEKRPILMLNKDGIFTTLNLIGRTGFNPIIDKLLYDVTRKLL
ncbi:MAG TPA: glycoside hydrolase family 2 TIM barrel-domain containing protein [Clostridia bacterium]|nr:MAG: Beta-galactosidase [Firmicutes bacterium ADurb.Bin146]HOD92458.1 glycoside hydrolase family 2 TIM barrel-domain containing protein [Clostridia bacterium]HQM38815.1 glycoside hydrolase family 2 TIM barrel-domain containing protein [Clostridia bacterium]